MQLQLQESVTTQLDQRIAELKRQQQSLENELEKSRQEIKGLQKYIKILVYHVSHVRFTYQCN